MAKNWRPTRTEGNPDITLEDLQRAIIPPKNLITVKIIANKETKNVDVKIKNASNEEAMTLLRDVYNKFINQEDM